jgi:hypothetical protein
LGGLSARWLVPGRVSVPNRYCIVLYCIAALAYLILLLADLLCINSTLQAVNALLMHTLRLTQLLAVQLHQSLSFLCNDVLHASLLCLLLLNVLLLCRPHTIGGSLAGSVFLRQALHALGAATAANSGRRSCLLLTETVYTGSVASFSMGRQSNIPLLIACQAVQCLSVYLRIA